METLEDLSFDYLDFTEIISELNIIQENQIIFSNNFIESIEIFSIFIGLIIGLVLGFLFVRVVFDGT